MDADVAGSGAEEPEDPHALNGAALPINEGESQKMDDGTNPAAGAGDNGQTMDQDYAEDQPTVKLRNPVERPVFKLSVQLLDTYKYINKVCMPQYHTRTSAERLIFMIVCFFGGTFLGVL